MKKRDWKAIIAISLVIVSSFIVDFFVTSLIVWAILALLGIEFSLRIALIAWLVIILLKSIFKISE